MLKKILDAIQIDLNLYTLLAVNLMPFAVFFYQIRNFNNIRHVKIGLFGFKVVAILLCAVLLIGQLYSLKSKDTVFYLFIIVHLMPLVLTALLASYANVVTKEIEKHFAPQLKEKNNQYLPKPENMKIEKLTWDDLIIDSALKSELNSVIELLKNPKSAKQYGIDVPKGILLEGPPGTGKTTLAKVVANTAGLSFFVLKLDEVVSMWVGESEKNLTKLFEAAKNNKPSVIFIDEVDSIGRARASGSSQHSDNLLNHMLQLIDGVVKTEGLYIIAATNRAELVDPALKRPGRLNKVIYVPLPNKEARAKMFAMYLSKMPLGERVDLDYLADLTEGCSGATIKAICNQAGLNAFKRESESSYSSKSHIITAEDIAMALNEFLH